MAGFLLSGGTLGSIALRIVLGCILCTAVALAGHRKKALSPSGALMSWVFGIIVMVLCGLSWFLLLLVFFAFAAAATKYKYKTKERIGAAQERLGARSWTNVVANGMSALLFVVSEFLHPGAIFVAGYLGAVSTAMADTLSSEIGMTSRRDPWLVTSFKRVKPGTHGGVSLLGTAAALAGCAVLALFAWGLRLETRSHWTLVMVAVICLVGGMVGTMVDSVMGALFERKGKMSNGQVNLFSTIAGGLAAMAVLLLL